MATKKPANIVLDCDSFLPDSQTFIKYCKDLEQSIHELALAIETHRKNKATRMTSKKD